MTFKDANGGEIKIADANGNAALETDELFMNEILGGITTDIGNLPAADAESEGVIEAEDISHELYDMLRDVDKPNKTSTSNQKEEDSETMTEEDYNEIRNEAIEKAKKELKEENPELSDTEIEEMAEHLVDTAILLPEDVQ